MTVGSHHAYKLFKIILDSLNPVLAVAPLFLNQRNALGFYFPAIWIFCIGEFSKFLHYFLAMLEKTIHLNTNKITISSESFIFLIYSMLTLFKFFSRSTYNLSCDILF